MLLDEPTAGMGHEDVGRVAELISKVAQDRTVLMVEHNLSVVADLSDVITAILQRPHSRRGQLRRGVEQPRGTRGLHGDRPCLRGRTAGARSCVSRTCTRSTRSHILHGVELSVREGEVVTLLGRNGAGKTTTLKSIMGIVEQRTGSIPSTAMSW